MDSLIEHLKNRMYWNALPSERAFQELYDKDLETRYFAFRLDWHWIIGEF